MYQGGRLHHLNVYIQKLKGKGAIHPVPGGYQIDDRLVPNGTNEVILRMQ